MLQGMHSFNTTTTSSNRGWQCAITPAALQAALLPGYALKVRQSLGPTANPDDVTDMQVCAKLQLVVALRYLVVHV